MSTHLKRHRTPSQTSSSSSTSSTGTQNPSKTSRTLPGHPESTSSSHPILCTLPPTCNRRPTPLSNTRDLENHYATYHAHVCEHDGCGTVFPDSRLLELHQTECHDPLAAVRKERGEKIFACHLSTCTRLFSTPKGRRLHLIQAHGFPKEYFFAVTNKGVGGLLKRWGEGVSLIRGTWKPRDENDDGEETDGDAIEVDRTDDDGKPQSRVATANGYKRGELASDSNIGNDDALASLVDNMGSLSLVPASIRFGRGGKKGGFPTSTLDRGHPGNRGSLRGRGRGGTPAVRIHL